MPAGQLIVYAARMVLLHGDDPQQSQVLRQVARLACAVIVVVATLGSIHGMQSQAAPEMAATAAALAVSVAGIAWILGLGTKTDAQTLIALLAVGFSGAVLMGLLPNEPGGYLLLDVALIGMGMELPPPSSFAAGFAVFAAANVSWLAARLTSAIIFSNAAGQPAA
jgi:hypothetical protein